MNYAKYEQKLKKLIDGYYIKHFENPREDLEVFVNDEFKRGYKR